MPPYAAMRAMLLCHAAIFRQRHMPIITLFFARYAITYATCRFFAMPCYSYVDLR